MFRDDLVILLLFLGYGVPAMLVGYGVFRTIEALIRWML